MDLPYVSEGIAALSAAVVALTGVFASRRLRKTDDKINEVELRAIQAFLEIALGVEADKLNLDLVSSIVRESRDVLEGILRFVESTPAPYIIWIKSRDKDGVFTMIKHNEHFHEVFLQGKEKNYYIGRTDHEVWPKEVADRFSKHDEKAYQTGKVITVTEPVYSKNMDTQGVARVSKWSFDTSQKSYVCGIGVYIVDTEEN